MESEQDKKFEARVLASLDNNRYIRYRVERLVAKARFEQVNGLTKE